MAGGTRALPAPLSPFCHAQLSSRALSDPASPWPPQLPICRDSLDGEHCLLIGRLHPYAPSTLPSGWVPDRAGPLSALDEFALSRRAGSRPDVVLRALLFDGRVSGCVDGARRLVVWRQLSQVQLLAFSCRALSFARPVALSPLCRRGSSRWATRCLAACQDPTSQARIRTVCGVRISDRRQPRFRGSDDPG